MKPFGQQKQEKEQSFLEKFGTDVTKAAEEGALDPVIGRHDEIRRVIQILARRRKNNPVLVGPAGVGKTAIVEGLAQRIVAGEVPNSLKARVVSVDMGTLLAGASYKGEFEERLQGVLREVKESAGKIILFIDELHTILGAGRSGGDSLDAANMLKPALARGELKCIGATTTEEYEQYIESDAAFSRRFQRVRVREPTVQEACGILRGLSERYASYHGVRILDSALVSAVKLSKRHITDRFLPDKAIDVMDEACAHTAVALDSVPEELDRLEKKKIELEVEKAALDKEKSRRNKARVKEIKVELEALEAKMKPLRAQFDEERSRVVQLRTLQEKLKTLKTKLAQAERAQDLQRAADLKYGAIPEVAHVLESLTKERRAEQDREISEGGRSARLLSEVVGEQEVAEVISRRTGIPVSKLCETETEKLLQLEASLNKRVVGQSAAVKAVSEAIMRSRAGLSRENQPTGSFLFVGSTGVGKTELAKGVASMLFDDETRLVRIDCSEYMEPHSVSRLIGAPPGYVGFEKGGQLTDSVKRWPYCVVLFDEVEKAHKDVLNVLLQVLDDGVLTDGKGRTVDFSNTIVILSSNVGSEALYEEIDRLNRPSNKSPELKRRRRMFDEEDPGVRRAKTRMVESVRRHFPPEFINRLDHVIPFNPLDPEVLSKITEHCFANVRARCAEKEMALRWTPAAKELIVEEAYDPQYGARPLKRYIEETVVSELSKLILRGKLRRGARVTIDKGADGRLAYHCAAEV